MIVILLVLLYLFRRSYRKHGVSPSLFVVATFLLSTVLGFLYLAMYGKEVYSYSYFSMIYYASTLAVLLFPLLKFPGFASSFTFPQPITNYLSYFLILGGFVSLYSSLQDFSFAEMAGNWAEVRAGYYDTWNDFEIATSLHERIEVNVSPLLYLCPPLAFYYLSKNKKAMGFLLILASLTTLIESIKIAERQDLLLWLVDYAMAYIMFYNNLSSGFRKTVFVVSAISGSLIVILIATITLARFGEGDDLIRSLYSYSAVQPFNAAYFLENLSDQSLGGRLNFSFIVGGKLITEINDHIRTATFLNSFASIVGSYYKDFGYYTIFVACVVSFIFYQIISFAIIKKSLLAFYFYCLYFNIMFAGVFYNKYSSPILFRMIVFLAVLIILYENLFPKNKRIKNYY